MRILLLPSSYPPILGGLQTVVHRLAQGLIQRGHNVQVVTQRYPRSLPAWEVLDGVPVRRWLFLTPDIGHLRQGRPDLFLASFYFFPITLLHLTWLMHTFRPDVINVHFPDSQIPFVLWLLRRFPCRLVVSLHGDEIERYFAQGLKPEVPGSESEDGALMRNGKRGRSVGHRQWAVNRLRSLLQVADAVTACSGYLLGRAIQLQPSVAEKGYVIHNGIDPQRFQDKTPYPRPRPYILAYGRLTYKKGFDVLLSALAQVAPEHPEVDLILAGDGEECDALVMQAQQLGLGDRVHFFGRATPEQVVQLLNGCLFVIVPSRLESFGIVALEAMAAGKPVLATRVGGLVEFVDGPVNRLVEPTVEGLAEGLEEWLGRGSGCAANDHLSSLYQERFAWATVVSKYERILGMT